MSDIRWTIIIVRTIGLIFFIFGATGAMVASRQSQSSKWDIFWYMVGLLMQWLGIVMLAATMPKAYELNKEESES